LFSAVKKASLPLIWQRGFLYYYIPVYSSSTSALSSADLIASSSTNVGANGRYFKKRCRRSRLWKSDLSKSIAGNLLRLSNWQLVYSIQNRR